MNWKTLAMCSALGSSALLTGCPSSEPPPDPPPPEVRNQYILSGGDIPEPTSDGFAVGFNLDGMESDGMGDTCQGMAIDYTSSISGELGVDNQLAGVVGLLAGELPDGVAGALREQIAEGTFLLVMDVTSNGLTNDDTVQVHFFLANRPGGPCDNAAMTCPTGSICPADATAAMPSNCGPMTDSMGEIAPGQMFTMAPMGDIASVTGSITDGHLLIELDSLPLTLVIDGNVLELELLNANVGADITEDTLTNGEIGAEVTVQNILDVAAVAGFPVTEDLIRMVAGPDLMPNADGSVCNSISAGLSFYGVEGSDPPTE